MQGVSPIRCILRALINREMKKKKRKNLLFVRKGIIISLSNKSKIRTILGNYQ